MITGKRIESVITVKDSKAEEGKISSTKQERQIRLKTEVNKLALAMDSQRPKGQLKEHEQPTLPTPINNQNIQSYNIEVNKPAEQVAQLSIVSNKQTIHQQSHSGKTPNGKSTKTNKGRQVAKMLKSKSKQKTVKPPVALKKDKKADKNKSGNQAQLNKQRICVQELIQNVQPQDQALAEEPPHNQQQPTEPQCRPQETRVQQNSTPVDPLEEVFSGMFLNSDIFLMSTEQLLKQNYISISPQG